MANIPTLFQKITDKYFDHDDRSISKSSAQTTPESVITSSEWMCNLFSYSAVANTGDSSKKVGCPLFLFTMLLGTLIGCAAMQPASAQDTDDWTPRKLLETVKYIADKVSVEDDETIAGLLRIELQSRERPSPEKDLVLKSQRVDYLSEASFRASRPIEEEGNRKRAYIHLLLKPEKICVQLEDAHAVLGEHYYVPRPRQIDFWTSSGEVDGEAIANELNVRDGRFDSIEYQPSALQQGVALVFFFRRCAREIWIARVLRSPK